MRFTGIVQSSAPPVHDDDSSKLASSVHGATEHQRSKLSVLAPVSSARAALVRVTRHGGIMYDHVKQQMPIVIGICSVARGQSFLSLGDNPHQAKISPVAPPLWHPSLVVVRLSIAVGFGNTRWETRKKTKSLMGFGLHLRSPVVRSATIKRKRGATIWLQYPYLPESLLHRLPFPVHLGVGSIMTLSHVLVVCLDLVTFFSRNIL